MAGPEDNWMKPWEPTKPEIIEVKWERQPRPERPSRMSDSIPGSENIGGGQGRNSNFLNYATIFLLAANLSAQWETKRVLQQQALDREMAFWADVAKERTGITDPLELRKRAEGLWAFNAEETTMREVYLSDNASTGIYPFLPGERISKGNAIAISVLLTVVGVVAGFLIGAVLGIATVIPYVITGGSVDIDGNLVIKACTVIGGAWAVFVSVRRMLYPAFSGNQFTSSHVDPLGSTLAGRFPPMSTVWDVYGNPYRVMGWPVYDPDSLKFRLPVDTETDMTMRFSSDADCQFSHTKFWYGPWLSSDYLDWEYSSQMSEWNKDEYRKNYKEWLDRMMRQRKGEQR